MSYWIILAPIDGSYKPCKVVGVLNSHEAGEAALRLMDMGQTLASYLFEINDDTNI